MDEVLAAAPLEAENLPATLGLFVAALDGAPEGPLPAALEAADPLLTGPLLAVVAVAPLLAGLRAGPLLTVLRLGPLLAALGVVVPLLAALRAGPLLLPTFDKGALAAGVADIAEPRPTPEPAEPLLDAVELAPEPLLR